MLRPFLLFGLLIACHETLSAHFLWAMDDSNRKIGFEIDSAPLSEALLRFADTAEISISMPPLSYRNGNAANLQGRFTVKKGLETLLHGTGFTFKVVSSKAVRIIKRPKQQFAPLHSIPEEPDWTNEPQIEEVLVSATKRTDFLQKIPYGASAINFRHSVGSFDTGVQDTVSKVAGLHATRQGDGQNKLIIRGLSDGAFTGRLQSLVATYLDYSRLTYSAPDPDLALIDIDRVEVLRGPQSTLYGSGALSGLYRVVTREPSLEETELAAFSTLSLTQRGTPSSGLSVLINTPFDNGKMAVRAVASYKKNGGYIDDIRLGERNVNDSQHFNTRLALKVRPARGWDLTLGASYRLIETTDSGYYNAALGWLQRDNYLAEPHRDELLQVAATLKADFKDIALVSTTTWMKRDINRLLDASAAVPGLVTFPVLKTSFTTGRGIETIINETHLSSRPGRRFEWVAGTFVSWRDDLIDADLIVPSESASGQGSSVFQEQLTDELREIALFGELTGYLSRTISITAGLRWFEYDDTYSSNQSGSIIGDALMFDGSSRQSGLVPKVLVSWYPNDDHLLYFQISQGYRLGGINLVGFKLVDAGLSGSGLGSRGKISSFESDKLTNFEFGWKATLPEPGLAINAIAYYADWTDIQGWEQAADELSSVNNIGDARVAGFELEAIYQPDDALALHANLAWNKSEVVRTTNQTQARKGDALPGAPEFSASVSLRRDIRIAGQAAELSTSYSYATGTSLLFGQAGLPETEDSHLVDFGLTVRPGSWAVTLYIDNLLASRASVFASSNPFRLAKTTAASTHVTNAQRWITPLRPRTVGISATWRY